VTKNCTLEGLEVFSERGISDMMSLTKLLHGLVSDLPPHMIVRHDIAGIVARAIEQATEEEDKRDDEQELLGVLLGKQKV
jgi:hypothetical protein